MLDKNILFFLFSIFLVFSAFMVVVAQHQVFSLLFLVASFLFAAFISISAAPEFWQLINSESFIFMMTTFVLGNIIGWPFIFSIIKEPYTLKQKLANGYIILLVSVLNHGQLPTRFIYFSISLGLFLGRRLILFLSIPYPKSVLMLFFSRFLFFI